MESILYNKEDKEVVIILGYGIGNHLSIEFLQNILRSILLLFPMSIDQANKLKFLEVSDNSRKHRYMWYTRFSYDMSGCPEDEHGYKTLESIDSSEKYKVLQVGSHKKDVDGWIYEDETAQQIMNRLIHD